MENLTREQILNSEAFKEILQEIAYKFGNFTEFGAQKLYDDLKNREEWEWEHFNKWRKEESDVE